MASRNFLAFDLSTQTLKGLLMDDSLRILQETVVHFDKDLPHYNTDGGVLKCSNSLRVTSPTRMWVESVDVLLGRMRERGCDFNSVRCLSGTGQQHGSVYWKTGSRNILAKLNCDRSLLQELKDCFSVEHSPVWMDSSTSKQCRALEREAGGATELAYLTGSAAYERFTGNQIAQICQENRSLYDNCERISLVSSFLASLFLGSYAPIDLSDGSGMNLLNINTGTWERKLLDACSDGLLQRLGEPVPSYSLIGTVSDYMVTKYNFRSDCQVAAFTGDNPASLAGMRLNRDDIAISLGTSDTLIFTLPYPKPSADIGHVFISPVSDEFMALLCYKNGSLTREHIRDVCGNASWDVFNQALGNSPPGNNGNMGIYFIEQEIIPFAKGICRWDSTGRKMTEFDHDTEIRAVVESQFLAKRIHVERIGFELGPDTRILATGGASANVHLLQIIADIFGACVYVIPETSNSACLGSAYRARHAWMSSHDALSFEQSLSQANVASPYQLSCSPRKDVADVYGKMRQRYIELEQSMSLTQC